MTYGLNKWPTLSAVNTTAPTSVQLGYTTPTPAYSAAGNFAAIGTAKVLCLPVALVAGTWVITFNTTISITIGALFRYIFLNIVNGAGTQLTAYQHIGTTAGTTAATNLNIPMSCVAVIASGGSTIQPVVSIISSAGTFATNSAEFNFTATRIA
jgi:hypothetical protein